MINDPQKVVELVNLNFLKAFTVDNNIPVPDLHEVVEKVRLEIIHFTRQAVVNILKRLKSSHTVTPDGFSCSTIKAPGPALAEPIRALFERLFSFNFYPPEWKQSYITPVYKSGVKQDMNN